MRIVLINPNTSTEVTDLLARSARRGAGAGTDLVPRTAAVGVPYISNRAEATIGARQVLEILAAETATVDGAIVAAFGDPGLGEARELFDYPVVGLAEAGMLTACMLGRRFGIVTFARALGGWYRECVAWHGLAGRCSGIRSLDEPFGALDTVAEEKSARLVALAAECIERDGADVIVLAGAPLAGLAASVRNAIPVPTVDCAIAAVRQVEALVALDPRPAAAGTYGSRAAKPTRGLPDALAAVIEGRAPGR